MDSQLFSTYLNTKNGFKTLINLLRLQQKINLFTSTIKSECGRSFRRSTEYCKTTAWDTRKHDGNILICFACKMTINKELRTLDENPLQACLRLNVVLTAGNHTCVECGSETDIHRVAMANRAFVFIQSDIFMPADTRTCQHHLDDKGCFVPLFLTGLWFVNRPITVNRDKFNRFLQGVRAVKQPLGFIDIKSLSDDDFHILIAMTRAQFEDMYSLFVEVSIEGGNRKVSKEDLFMFLTKLRQGLSDDLLKVMFGYSSRQHVSLAVSTVRQSLELRFVPENIGLDNMHTLSRFFP